MTVKSEPLITIAIPTYNRADSYLSQTLESAVNQTYRNIEILISDNCSTDNTESVVKSFNDPRICYFRQKENIKANENFNFLLKEARGDYFLLLHDDDLIDSDFVETCIKAANYSTNIGLIRTGMRRIDSQEKVLAINTNDAIHLSTEDFFLLWFNQKIPMHLCMSLFNTKYLKLIGGFNSKHQLFQDVLAEVILAAKYGRMDIKNVKASYRMHAGQYSCSAKIKLWCEDSIELLDIICKLASNNHSLLRSKGIKFFLIHNYNLTQKVISPFDRFRSLLTIFNYFGYYYSLKYIFVDKVLHRVLYKIKYILKLIRCI